MRSESFEEEKQYSSFIESVDWPLYRLMYLGSRNGVIYPIDYDSPGESGILLRTGTPGEARGSGR
jgi:hypothetical protein